MKRLIGYTTPQALRLYFAGFAVTLLAGLVASATDSKIVLALGVSASLLMWWPLVRDLVPVAFSVLIHGRWPTRDL
ncbi:hypothetical protein JH25_27665 [Pseudomonas sp. BRG-100]|uniref:hypothetical protein n=1 Tax=Pseudomonas sp. BRG-100 TaxID=1524267 RepID=UPI0004E61D98|nr:hypothetical protein [Pseudomonas sp. BRG-100]KFF42155.1 hypothetical protein JH25_27665 [Pseudomonas sp. BRG-100]